MKPVAIFRHSPTEGPGHFGRFLDERRIAWRLVRLDEGEPVPGSAAEFAGLAFMGGTMCANDDLPWIDPVLALMRDASSREVPVIGHCLGGQLLSKALGGSVTRNPVKEIGWNRLEVDAGPVARDWLGAGLREFMAFQWHGDTFSIPPGATRILRGEHCANQAFAAGDRHLGMQCHVEMTPELVSEWCASGSREIAENLASPAVQPVAAIAAQSPGHLSALNRVADRLYSRWIRGLRG